MSVLPAEIHTALDALLKGLQSPDNVERTNAEEQLNKEWVGERPDVLLMGLSEQIQLSQESSVSWPEPAIHHARPTDFRLPTDSPICRCAVPAPVFQAAQGRLLWPDTRPVLDLTTSRARGDTRKALAVPQHRERQLGEG